MSFTLNDVSHEFELDNHITQYYLMVCNTTGKAIYFNNTHNYYDINSMFYSESWHINRTSQKERANAIDLGVFESMQELHALVEFRRALV